MDPAIKKVVAVLTAALIVVIGAILVINTANMKAAVTTENEIKTQDNIEENQQADADAEPTAEEMPTDGAQAGETGVTNEAQDDEAAQNDVMYEGALAGLSEEEIAKMAMAEEESAARTETSGVEDAVD